MLFSSCLSAAPTASSTAQHLHCTVTDIGRCTNNPSSIIRAARGAGILSGRVLNPEKWYYHLCSEVLGTCSIKCGIIFSQHKREQYMHIWGCAPPCHKDAVVIDHRSSRHTSGTRHHPPGVSLYTCREARNAYSSQFFARTSSTAIASACSRPGSF